MLVVQRLMYPMLNSSTAAVNVDSTKVTTAGNTFGFTISNGKDTLVGGACIDNLFVTDAIYLSTVDNLAGGSGNNNVFHFNDTDAAAETNTFAATQFQGVSGFDTFYFTDDAAADTFDITIDNSVAAANAHTTTSVLTFDMNNGAGTDQLGEPNYVRRYLLMPELADRCFC